MSDTPTDDALRVHRRHQYVNVPSWVYDDERLDYRSLGLLTYMLSRPPGWRFAFDRLARQNAVLDQRGREQMPGKRMGREGRLAVRASLNQLEALGYYRRGDRSQDARGRWRTGPPTVTDTPGEFGP